MKKIIIATFILSISLVAESNTTASTDKNDTNSSSLNENIKKMIEKEKKYKKEQKFYMGDEYNLTEHQVDPKIIDKVPVIEPEYDFDISDLYSD